MSAPFVPALDTFAGGQMTDLPAFTSPTLDGTELFEIVSGFPSPTTAANAVNYSVTSLQLAIAIATLSEAQVVIAQGQNTTALTAYPVPVNVTRVYVNKATPEPTYVKFGNANAQLADVLVKDIAGTSDGAGNGIFTTVTADTIVNPTITVPYGGFFFRPVKSLNIWTLGIS
jgi:hypothetical protein